MNIIFLIFSPQYNVVWFKMVSLVLFFCLMSNVVIGDDQLDQAKNLLTKLNDKYSEECTKRAFAEWAYETNINDDTYAKYIAANEEFSKIEKPLWEEVKNFPWQKLTDPDMHRQFYLYSVVGEAALPDDKSSELSKILGEMENTYNTARVCEYKNNKNCNLSWDPDLDIIMEKSTDEAELAYYWTEYMKNSGEKMRPIYPAYVSLLNEAAQLNGFKTAAEMWLSDYEEVNMEPEFAKLYEDLLPLYKQLFAYVRRKLREKFGEQLISKNGPIPVHLLRSMFGVSWNFIADLATPYPDVKLVDITELLKKQNYTPLKIFQSAEEFYTSISLEPMNDGFWKNSMIEKPPDREVVCPESAWDFCNKEDFRIKMCTQIDDDDFYACHHEMGHIEYYMEYKDLPYCYRDGANAGFQEAMGDLIALSVFTQNHLHKVGILSEVDDSKEADINFLFQLALKKIAILPFAYLLDLWRWKVFRGEIKEENYNCEWWKIVLDYQGLKPPNMRNEKNFEPGGKVHVATNWPYISYFVSHILQFQFHQTLCIKAKQFDPNSPDTKPLHHCDIYQSKEAGALLKEVMKLGRSKPWQDTLEYFTGNRNVDAGPIKQYFAPLLQWLQEDNDKSGELVGWEVTETVCQTN